MENRQHQVEILAPAGSYESFMAAIAAGADAVYLGGNMFGARAFAQNFGEEELKSAIDYAHLHGRKLYLTVNTLLKEKELTEQLYDYLAPLYEHGLDAVIVQDLGVLQFIKHHFPGLELHASTQMTVTGSLGASLLKKYGVQRIVPARELSLSEIRKMKDETNMEIECFVHGALCYCYSGQCLMSSLIGGRSGNRGQCAQPCRLPYEYQGKSGYLLSLKDICTLDIIPELIEAGIDSFKIEGRMKKPEYVAGVTSIYRKYVDLYYRVGSKAYRVEEADKERLMDLYNRGGFYEGYYRTHNGRDMLSLKRPNHAGTEAVRVVSQKGRELQVQAMKVLEKGDILEISEEYNYTLGKKLNTGDKYTIIIPKKLQFSKGTVLNRTRCSVLIDELQNSYLDRKIQEKVYGFLKLFPEKPATLELSYGEWHIMVSGEEVQYASSRPLEEERVRKQMEKTGNMSFCFENLEIAMSSDCFYPMQQLNNLRREAADALEAEILNSYRRVLSVKFSADESHNTDLPAKLNDLIVSVETIKQLEYFANYSNKGRIYIESGLFLTDKTAFRLAETCKKSGWEVLLSLPHIFREEHKKRIVELIHSLENILDGILICNLEELKLLQDMKFDKEIIGEHNLYIFNQEAKKFYLSQGVKHFTAPLELNYKELEQLNLNNCECIVYGYEPVMVTAQCLEKTCHGCTKNPGFHSLKDRYQKIFTVKNDCVFCYNKIYNPDPLMLFGESEVLNKLNPCGYRLMFTRESEKEIAEIMELYEKSILQQKELDLESYSYTKGHFRRGVK